MAAIVGDFNTAEMIAHIEEMLGKIPAGTVPPQFNRPEPAQQGERRVRVERPGPTPVLSIAYHVPEAKHPDWMKLYMLDSILGGARGFGGGGVGNKNPRFHQGLGKKELAAPFSSGVPPPNGPVQNGIEGAPPDWRRPEE